MQTPRSIAEHDLYGLYRTAFAQELRRSVKAFLKQRRMSPSRFGREALRDPAFVTRRLRKHRAVTLRTADRARRFMRMQPFRPLLVCEIRAFIEITGLEPWQVGEWALGHPRFVTRLYRGASPFLPTIDRLRLWMHRQLRAEQFEAVFLVVAGELGGNRCGADVFFSWTTNLNDRRSVDERSAETVDDARGRRAAWPEPENAGALPRHRRGPAVPKDRALGALYPGGPRAVARTLHEVLHVRRRARGGRSAVVRAGTGTFPRVSGTGAVCAAVAVRLAFTAGPAALSLLTGMEASATTDTTFAAPLTTVTDMVGGTGGQLAAVLAVGAALVGSVLRFNATQIMGAVGVGVAAGAGAGVVTSIVGTAIV